MKKYSFILLSLGFLFVACKKEDPQDNSNNLPEGAEPYTEANIQFVPYTSGNKTFRTWPALDSSLTLVFSQRVRTEEYFAWDQTYFTFDVDPQLELELRLRYLQTDNSQKTLAMYMPYQDATGTYRTNIFEVPIENPQNIESGFFKELIDYHDTLQLGGSEWYKVYEINELISTDEEKDGPTNFTKIYYTSFFGIIQMEQKNGTTWVLQL